MVKSSFASGLNRSAIFARRAHQPSVLRRRSLLDRAARAAHSAAMEDLEQRRLLDGTGLVGSYHDNIDITGFVVQRSDANINFNWSDNAPVAGIGADTFSVRWVGKIETPTGESGTYTFKTHSDDGVRLWVNNTAVINNWQDQHGDNTGTITLTGGQQYDFRLEYYDNGWGAEIQLSWDTPSTTSSYVVVPQTALYPEEWPGTGAGLPGTYYNNSNLTGTTANRTDGPVNFNWGNGAPITGIDADTFSVRWQGYVQAIDAGTYTFRTTSDDGARLWVDNTQLVNAWQDQGYTAYSGTKSMTSGQAMPITLEYYDNQYGAAVKLEWKRPGKDYFELIPDKQLYTDDPTATIPDAPSGLAAVLVGPSQVNLAWTDNSTNETTFKIQRATNDTFTANLTNLSPDAAANATSYSDSQSLSASTTYYYRICAHNSAGDSDYSDTLMVTTAPSVGGSLSGSTSTTLATPWTMNLTTLAAGSGNDWAHWNGNGFMHKNGVDLISNVTRTSTNNTYYGSLTDAQRNTTWTDGTSPYTTGTNDHGEIWYNNGTPGSGWTFTVPADTTTRTLVIVTSNWEAERQITAHLSDSSASDVTQTIAANSDGDARTTTITYRAASAGQTLTITYIKSANGSVTYGSANLISAYLVADTATPSAPTSLDATASSSSAINVTWTDAASNESGFTLQRATDASFTQNVVSVGLAANTTSYSATGLTASTTYYFRVRSQNVTTTSAWSNTDSATTPPSGPTIPQPPLNLTATRSGLTVNLAWTDNSNNEDGFNVEESLDPNFAGASPVTTNTPSFSDATNSYDGVTHYYRVQAYNTAGTSSWISASVVIPPAAPGSFTATAGDGQVALTWTASTGATSYNLYQSTTSGAYGAPQAGLTGTSNTVTGLTNGTPYYFKISESNSGGEGPLSSEVSATPAVPLQIVIGGDGSTDEGSQYTLSIAASGSAAATTPLHINWGDGQSDNVAAGTPSYTHSYLDGALSASAVVSGTVGSNTYNSNALAVAVQNVDPIADFTPSASADEGGTIALAFTNSVDPSPTDATAGFTYSFDFDGDGTWDVLNSTSSSATSSEFADDGWFGAVGRIKDKDGGYTDYFCDVTIANVAPTVAISGSSTALVGDSYALSLSASGDPGPDSIQYWEIDWGDGASFSQVSGSSASHVYTVANGQCTIKAWATDEDGTYEANILQVTPSIDLPEAPTSLAASATAGESKATLSWSDQSDNESGFAIEQSFESGGFVQVAWVGSGTTSYIVQGLTDGHYDFRVRAFNDGGNSDYSNTDSADISRWLTHGEVSVSGDTITVGVPDRLEDDTQDAGVHGVSVLLPPRSQYSITFDYDLSTWDSYNAPTEGNTGYWDSFSASVTDQPYWNLSLVDPLSYPYVWGGEVYGDGTLETDSGSRTITFTGNPSGNNYLNFVLDTNTASETDGAYPSWGVFTIGGLPTQANSDIDLDIDSFNDNGFALPDDSRTDEEEDIEADPATPGKIIAVNDDDDDQDGVPDFADFTMEKPNGQPARDHLVPIVLELDPTIDLATAKLKLTYDASDPSAITMTGDGSPDNPYIWHPGPGSLRLWTWDLARVRSSSSFVTGPGPGDTSYYVPPSTGDGYGQAELEKLGFVGGNRKVTLYVEAVAPTTDNNKRQIKVEVVSGGQTVEEVVRVTPVKINLDVNDDGDLNDPMDDVARYLPGYAPSGTNPTKLVPALSSGAFNAQVFTPQEMKLIVDGLGANMGVDSVTFEIVDVSNLYGYAENISAQAVQGGDFDNDFSFDSLWDGLLEVPADMGTSRSSLELYCKDYGGWAKIRATASIGGNTFTLKEFTLPNDGDGDRIADFWERQKVAEWNAQFDVSEASGTDFFAPNDDKELRDPDGANNTDGGANLLEHRTAGDSLKVSQEYRGFVLDGGGFDGSGQNGHTGGHKRLSPALKELLVETDVMAGVEHMPSAAELADVLNNSAKGFSHATNGAGIRVYWLIDEASITHHVFTSKADRRTWNAQHQTNPLLNAEFMHLAFVDREDLAEFQVDGVSAPSFGVNVDIHWAYRHANREGDTYELLPALSSTVAHEITHNLIDAAGKAGLPPFQSNIGFDPHEHIIDPFSDDAFRGDHDKAEIMYEQNPRNRTSILFSDITRGFLNLKQKESVEIRPK